MADDDADLALVRLLADGDRHSGAALAARLGVSRAAVCKAVHRAKARLGLAITARRGHGYRLAAPLELLDAAAIHGALPPDARARLGALAVLTEVDSTSDEVRRMSAAAGTDGPADRAGTLPAPAMAPAMVCLAERQRAGRGRQGRAWVTPFGGALALSIGWRLPLAPAQLGGLSLAAGVAVIDALGAAGAPLLDRAAATGAPATQGVGLKWPNDLHWRRRKLAGLLVEVSGEAQGPSRVVLGVGLNLAFGPDQGDAIDQPWVDLATVLRAAGRPAAGRNALAAGLIDRLTALLARYPETGFAPFRDPWQRRDCYRGETATIHVGRESLTGQLAGIDDDGALLLDTGDGRRRILSGEVGVGPRPG